LFPEKSAAGIVAASGILCRADLHSKAAKKVPVDSRKTLQFIHFQIIPLRPGVLHFGDGFCSPLPLWLIPKRDRGAIAGGAKRFGIKRSEQEAGVNGMKRFLLGVVGVVAMGIAAPALAADLPAQTYSKTPVMIPAAYDWSGVYVGINGGWGSEHRCFDSISAAGIFIAADGCHNTSGAVAGAQIGYRLQTGSWVYGLEFQGDWANLSGSNVSVLNPPTVNRSRMDAFGLFTGQIGYSWNTALLYLKGGAAVIADRNDILSGGVVVATSSGDNRWGGALGTGLEFSFAPNWSAAVEYDHLFIANNNTNFTVPPASTPFGSDRIRGDTDLVTVRVNYRWGGPVVAKY
jgi:outer membrane immunogenic protein